MKSPSLPWRQITFLERELGMNILAGAHPLCSLKLRAQRKEAMDLQNLTGEKDGVKYRLLWKVKINLIVPTLA